MEKLEQRVWAQEACGAERRSRGCHNNRKPKMSTIKFEHCWLQAILFLKN